MLGLLCSLSIISCQDSQTIVTPEAPVYLQLQLQRDKYRSLLSPSTMLRLTSPEHSHERLGYGGLILVHGLEWGAYYAFDLSCPYENRPDVRIIIDGLRVMCPSCKSEYDILGGSGAVLVGVSRSPLKRYSCRYNEQTKVLSVSN